MLRQKTAHTDNTFKSSYEYMERNTRQSQKAFARENR